MKYANSFEDRKMCRIIYISKTCFYKLCYTRYRLHREALKQSATDPLSGKIDVNIITTGLSAAARQRRHELTQQLKKLIEQKGKSKVIPYQQLFTEIKTSIQTVNNYIFFSIQNFI